MTKIDRVMCTYAAQLLGCDQVATFEELPAGVKINFHRASEERGFADCNCVGDYLQRYIDVLQGMLNRSSKED